MQRPAAENTADAATFLPRRRNRDFSLLLAGSSTSMLGSRVSAIAYPMLVLTITGSPVIAGWACFAAAVPAVLFYLPAGAVADRCDPRRMMLICESLRGLATTGVVAVMLFGHVSMAQLITAAVAGQILEIFSTLAERRLTQSLVNSGNQASALSRCEARTHIAIMVGRPLGAVLFATARVLPFIADALSFGACVGTLLYIPPDRKESLSRQRVTRHMLREINEGLGWIHDHPFARIALPLTAGTTLIGQALIMIFLGQAHADHLAYAVVGMILACSGVGGALGAAVASRLFRRFGYQLFGFQLSAWIAIFAILAFWAWRSFPVAAVAMTVMGFTGALGNVALDMYVFSNARATILARVMSSGDLISFGALALGPLLGGILLMECGAQCAIVLLLIGTALLKLAARHAPPPRTHPDSPNPPGRPLWRRSRSRRSSNHRRITRSPLPFTATAEERDFRQNWTW
jgi:MFS family permease